MAERYNDILKVSIGKVLASALIDNYFSPCRRDHPDRCDNEMGTDLRVADTGR